MAILPPALEEILTSLVEYAGIFNEQTRLLSLDPEALFVASRDESNRCHILPLPTESTQEHLERLSDFCRNTPADSVNACVRILNAAAACLQIVQHDILGALSDEEKLLVLEKYDRITKAAIDSACETSFAVAALPPTRAITSKEHGSFAANPLTLVGRKFANPATDETIEILDFGIKMRAGQVFDVAFSSAHDARRETTVPWHEVKEILVECRAVIQDLK